MTTSRATAWDDRPVVALGIDRRLRRRRTGGPAAARPADDRRRRLEHGLSGSARPLETRSKGRARRTVVVVDNHGTGGGFSRYLEGEVDIVDASRPAKPDEEAKAKAQGIDWTRFLVGYDGITLVVNPKNDFVKSLTVEQLKAIWAPASKVKTWKDVDPAWPDRKIILYSPDNDSGTFEFFTEAIVGKAKSQRDDVQLSSDDNIAGQRRGRRRRRAGLFRLRLLRGQQGQAAGRGRPERAERTRRCFPAPTTIIDKTYAPLSRPLYHLREELGRPAARGRPVSQVLSGQHRPVRRRRAVTLLPRPRTRRPTRRRSPSCSRRPRARPSTRTPATK